MGEESMAEVMSYICPTCGSEAQVGTPCPGCSKRREKARRSWEQDPSMDGLGETQEFDYEDFVQREFGRGKQAQGGLKWYWWLLAVLVLVAFVAVTFGLS
ncbi:hypothetical protein JIN85_03860 [Luteolibacter pohnpeiensis]|uniref:Zinc ribbon domain-containing protein n=2 Tax=Luteolibacter pohnpeiensis TaxID=454153 RepID=A0A934S690_9BACT|nr:hypothetical protein [Luteolibacter pohnpeiensis]